MFYGKWHYKIQCHIHGGHLIKRNGLTQTLIWCLDPTPPTSYWADINKTELLAFANAVQPFLDQELQIRTEHDNFSVFCRDQSLFESMIKGLEPWICIIHRPANAQEHEFIIEHGHKKTLCKQLPYARYRYRVMITHNTDADVKFNFLNWANNYGDAIKLSAQTTRWLKHQPTPRWVVPTPFVYVENEKDLIMIRLFLGKDIKNILEFIPRTMINNHVSGELIC